MIAGQQLKNQMRIHNYYDMHALRRAALHSTGTEFIGEIYLINKLQSNKTSWNYTSSMSDIQ